jgi:ketosteroid isomerase-like protein
MTDDHVLVDATGDAATGHAALEEAWLGYLNRFPDYRIELERVLEDGETAVAIGTASATAPLGPWRVPAAWKAVVRGGRLAEWRVYSDTKTVYDLLS